MKYYFRNSVASIEFCNKKLNRTIEQKHFQKITVKYLTVTFLKPKYNEKKMKKVII